MDKSWENKEVEAHPKYNGDFIAVCDIGFFKGVSKNIVINAMEEFGVLELVKEKHPIAFQNLCLDLPC